MDKDTNKHEAFMKKAIDLSRQAALIEKSGGVFGAVIVKNGVVIAEGYNQVIRHNDPTWHAEMQAIREAGKKLNSPHLLGCVMYTSAECCPMCLSAAYWAHLEHIYYAATVADAFEYGDFQDEGILAELRLEHEMRKIKRTQISRDEALAVWKAFALMPNRARY